MERVDGTAEVGARLAITFVKNGGRSMTMRPTVLAADPGVARDGLLGIDGAAASAHGVPV